ncbi:hypothetical protein [uncultured Kordia sp.]|uniref:hypothetical protein n=1 Tax=uncultured Kordia sp. TaxID=507699 RepID=UPI002602534E|nr:hypothetical protein [uncultured Kordia sp.]
MKKKNLNTMHLRKRLIANMQANHLQALKGGTRPDSDDLFVSVDLTFCQGKQHCENNMSA